VSDLTGPIKGAIRLIRDMRGSDIALVVACLCLLAFGFVRDILDLPYHRTLALIGLTTVFLGVGWHIVTAIKRRRMLDYFQEAIQKTPSTFALYDKHDHLIAHNAAYEAFLDIDIGSLPRPITAADLVRATLPATLDDAARDREFRERLRGLEEASEVATDRRYPNGRWLRMLAARTECGATVAVGIDVSELYEAKALASHEYARFRGVAETSPVGIWHFDRDGRTLFVNQALLTLFGLSAEADLHAVRAPRFIADHLDGLEISTIAAGGATLGTKTLNRRGGDIRQVIVFVSDLPHDRYTQGEKLVSFVDVTALKDAEQRVNYLAHHDLLTGAENRAAFQDRIDALAQVATREVPCWILVMDLDGFKPVNDQYGHATGDSLLCAFFERIDALRPRGSGFFRLGGDEFCLLLREASRERVDMLATAIVNAASQTFLLEQGAVRISMSVGIAAMPLHTETPELAQRYADLALYVGKEAGGRRHVFFDAELAERDLRERIMTLDLGRAVADDEFELVYQPVFTRKTGKVACVEALLRWTNRRNGQQMMPGDFIPIAERVGVIASIDMWVLGQVARQLKDWKARGVAVSLLMVNMSPPTLEDTDFLDHVDRILEHYPEIAGHICIELTEGVVVQDRIRLSERFEALKERGIQTAIDDFGTGHTSIALLRDLPVSFIKIDRSYIDGIEHNPQARAIVTTVITLGQYLGVDVIGEGVETEAQLAALDVAGCALIQGYLLAKPVSGDEIEAILDVDPPSCGGQDADRIAG